LTNHHLAVLFGLGQPEEEVKVTPLAFDSLGVRSMATFVETDLKTMIDPGLDLAPSRYGLPPTRPELDRAKELSEEIHRYAKETEIFIITHYHHDHYFPEADFYRGKILLLKHPLRDINFNQRKRAKLFLKSFGNKAKRIEFADGKQFEFSDTRLKVSSSFPHGEALSKSGFVIGCSVSHGAEKLVFASDVQGPQVRDAVDWIVAEDPDLVILSGYPTYLKQNADERAFKASRQNLIEILARTRTKIIILDHHLTRDSEYRDKIKETVERARSMGRDILTAAEYLGKEPDLLEAKRKELHRAERGEMSPGS
jgi:predicted metallo-beta-lactamase superfamily hydrolase